MSHAAVLKVLSLNSGSSSVKFGLYQVEPGAVVPLMSGEVEAAAPDAALFPRIDTALGDLTPDAVGHRVVHGGPYLFEPVMIGDPVITQLEQATAFAPLHMPASLRLITTARARYPTLPHVACFDTGFHANLPEVAAVLPIPVALEREGLRRYGFHGLSCQSIIQQLGEARPERLIIAHLGAGASVTAVRSGRSVDTSMGLTPSGGVVMATRAGDVDPGLLVYLIREYGMDAAALEELFDRRSGLLGVSDVSGDLRRLHAAAPTNPRASLALRIFHRSVSKAIAGMMATLGGADLIVFTGGVGENDVEVRRAILGDLEWAGVPSHGGARGQVEIMALPSQEGEQIARDTCDAVCDSGSSSVSTAARL